jgi:hypothetical protein
MHLQARRYEDFYHRLLRGKRQCSRAESKVATAKSASSLRATEQLQ